LKKVLEGASRREFLAKIYNLQKTSVDMHAYVTDISGVWF